MPKPTKSEIAAEILDRAAALFARHGFAHTSLQQIADAVNYSKAGLLHHYPSKQAIYDAVLRTGTDHMQSLLENVQHIPVGVERDRAVVEASVDFTYDWPGLSSLANRLADQGEDVEDVYKRQPFRSATLLMPAPLRVTRWMLSGYRVAISRRSCALGLPSNVPVPL